MQLKVKQLLACKVGDQEGHDCPYEQRQGTISSPSYWLELRLGDVVALDVVFQALEVVKHGLLALVNTDKKFTFRALIGLLVRHRYPFFLFFNGNRSRRRHRDGMPYNAYAYSGPLFPRAVL